jgi:hypothetical protein
MCVPNLKNEQERASELAFHLQGSRQESQMPQVQMTESTGHRLWQFVKRQILDDAPEDIAICEFDCRHVQCMQDNWGNCERRIRKGAGELFPDTQPRKH